jgi:uncharacterized protein YqjF (DUF2071 family)
MPTETRDGQRTFLTAEWRHLLMLNYRVERELLQPFVPAGTILDTHQGVAYVSVVGFLFLKTRVLGVPLPFHQDFEELNLRFYVRRFAEGAWRRGVVFIKEIVPKPAIAIVARIAYGENYVSLPMRHRMDLRSDGSLAALEYRWEFNGRWNNVNARTTGEWFESAPGSLEDFITEHFWGYAKQPGGSCVEYQVEHPRWRLWRTEHAALDCDAAALYGEPFTTALNPPPASSFVAEGSAVTVFRGRRILKRAAG